MENVHEETGFFLGAGAVRQVTDKFKVRTFVVKQKGTHNGKDWENFINFQLVQKNVDLVDGLKPGDTITVAFNVKGNKVEKDGNTKYYNNLNAWKVEKEGNSATEAAPAQEPITADDNIADDLPF